MFELRWLKREEPAPEHGRNMFRNVKVLQFRQRSNIEEIGIQPPIWDEWQDVPTEESK